MGKKLLNSVLLLCMICTQYTGVSADQTERYFIVTAYYSPLPDQDYYAMGNYEAEIRMNGRGTNGASGAEVFSGMLAAPHTYAFGTKIYLEGLGVGSVEDRGGAIVTAGNRGYTHDRIDVWMGYGEEGLRRSIYWGKRKIKGNIVSGNTTLDYHTIPAPLWVSKHIKKAPPVALSAPVVKTLPQKTIFDVPANTSQRVKQLQGILSDLGWYDGEQNGEYESLVDTIFAFQVEYGILDSKYDAGAGYYGPATRKKLQEVYELYQAEQQRIKQREKLITEIRTHADSQAAERIEHIGKLRKGMVGPSVRELQLVLKQLGYFDHKDTAIFGDITEKSILAFQLDHEIIEAPDSLGAGHYGPKTRQKLTQILGDHLYEQALKDIEK